MKKYLKYIVAVLIITVLVGGTIAYLINNPSVDRMYSLCVDESNLDMCNSYLYETTYLDEELSKMDRIEIDTLIINRNYAKKKKELLQEKRNELLKKYQETK